MSDELMLQYERLEQKVAERTQELEISKVSHSSITYLLEFLLATIIAAFRPPFADRIANYSYRKRQKQQTRAKLCSLQTFPTS